MNISRKDLPLLISSLLNALVLPAALLAIVLPNNSVFGWAFFALLWAGTFEYVRGLLVSRGRESLPVLITGFLIFLLLPFLHMFLSALPLVPGHILFALRSLVLLPSLLMAIGGFMRLRKDSVKTDSPAATPLPQPLGGEDAGAWKPGFRSLFPLGASLLASVVVVLIIRRAFSAPEGSMFGVMIPQSLPFAALGFLHLAGLIILSSWRVPISAIWRLLIATPAFAAALMAIFPLAQLPSVDARARKDFLEAYGEEPGHILGNPDGAPLAAALFNPASMYLWQALPEAFVEEDILYLEEEARDGIVRQFRFDRWLPAAKGDAAQTGADGKAADGGPYPVVIRIHGGAWVTGDKGTGHINAMNRHLASSGYAVFDIQYGLNNRATFSADSGAMSAREGPYELADMLGHLAAFTRYLADNAQRLKADTSRVFISGASAGGHLALLLALSQGRGPVETGPVETGPGEGGPDDAGDAALYPAACDPRLEIRGLVPLYPAVGLASTLGIEGTALLDDPSLLLSADAVAGGSPGGGNASGEGALAMRQSRPPLLIYQGLIDGMVPWKITHGILERAAASAYDPVPAMAVWFPLNGHGNDITFFGPSSQVFRWYSDRFLALYAR